MTDASSLSSPVTHSMAPDLRRNVLNKLGLAGSHFRLADKVFTVNGVEPRNHKDRNLYGKISSVINAADPSGKVDDPVPPLWNSPMYDDAVTVYQLFMMNPDIVEVEPDLLLRQIYATHDGIRKTETTTIDNEGPDDEAAQTLQSCNTYEQGLEAKLEPTTYASLTSEANKAEALSLRKSCLEQSEDTSTSGSLGPTQASIDERYKQFWEGVRRIGFTQNTPSADSASNGTGESDVPSSHPPTSVQIL